METAVQNLLANRKVHFGIQFLTYDHIRDQECDGVGMPWTSDDFAKARSKAKEVLSRDNVVETVITVEFVVETLKK